VLATRTTRYGRAKRRVRVAQLGKAKEKRRKMMKMKQP
jgi:hypothetical protein